MKKIIKNNKVLFNIYNTLRYFIYKNFFTNVFIIKFRFKRKTGRKVNLSNPRLYNDKIQWLKLNWYNPKAVTCADKYAVRDHVKRVIGKKYLNTLYKKFNTVDEIKFNELPTSFVLKSTHGTGDIIICEDKEKLNWENVKKTMRSWLNRNVYWITREWVYKDITPGIICEKYLCTEENIPPNDYKFFCFNGEPKLIQVDANRFANHSQSYYDIDWNPKNVHIGTSTNDNMKITKPDNLEEMIEISRKLSTGFPHVRVDLYNIEGLIIFGELTFFHRNGLAKFHPSEFEKEMGGWLILPNKSRAN